MTAGNVLKVSATLMGLLHGLDSANIQQSWPYCATGPHDHVTRDELNCGKKGEQPSCALDNLFCTMSHRFSLM